MLRHVFSIWGLKAKVFFFYLFICNDKNDDCELRLLPKDIVDNGGNKKYLDAISKAFKQHTFRDDVEIGFFESEAERTASAEPLARLSKGM